MFIYWGTHIWPMEIRGKPTGVSFLLLLCWSPTLNSVWTDKHLFRRVPSAITLAPLFQFYSFPFAVFVYVCMYACKCMYACTCVYVPVCVCLVLEIKPRPSQMLDLYSTTNLNCSSRGFVLKSGVTFYYYYYYCFAFEVSYFNTFRAVLFVLFCLIPSLSIQPWLDSNCVPLA